MPTRLELRNDESRLWAQRTSRYATLAARGLARRAACCVVLLTGIEGAEGWEGLLYMCTNRLKQLLIGVSFAPFVPVELPCCRVRGKAETSNVRRWIGFEICGPHLGILCALHVVLLTAFRRTSLFGFWPVREDKCRPSLYHLDHNSN